MSWTKHSPTIFGELRYFGGLVPWSFPDIPFTRLDNDRIAGYRDNAEADVPPTPTFRYWPTSAAMMSYNKTALWLHTLERHLGWPVMQRILSTFFTRWQFRHPQPADLFRTVNEVSGQVLTWFFDQVSLAQLEHLRLRRARSPQRARSALRCDAVRVAPPRARRWPVWLNGAVFLIMIAAWG